MRSTVQAFAASEAADSSGVRAALWGGTTWNTARTGRTPESQGCLGGGANALFNERQKHRMRVSTDPKARAVADEGDEEEEEVDDDDDDDDDSEEDDACMSVIKNCSALTL